MLKTKTQKIVSAIIVLIGLIFGGTQLMGSAPIVTEGTLMGSASNFISFPNTYVDSFSTTTDSGTVEDAGTITQSINVKNYNTVRFNLGLVGGSPTSTPFIKFQTSPDNVNFFEITGSSTSTDDIATSTLQRLPRVLTLADPGITSSTQSFTYDVSSISFLRVMFRQEKVTEGQNDDGVQGWVNYQLFGEY